MSAIDAHGEAHIIRNRLVRNVDIVETTIGDLRAEALDVRDIINMLERELA